MDYIMKFISDYWLVIVIVVSLFGWGGYSGSGSVCFLFEDWNRNGMGRTPDGQTG